MENLAYSGAFDCFKEYHRAQYFHVPESDTKSGLERIIHFGNQLLNNKQQSGNSLFGDDIMPEIPSPRLPHCEPQTLTELLDHEKVAGMFMSGHPLDHFRFELAYYGIVPLADFNEIRKAPHLYGLVPGAYRIAGW